MLRVSHPQSRMISPSDTQHGGSPVRQSDGDRGRAVPRDPPAYTPFHAERTAPIPSGWPSWWNTYTPSRSAQRCSRSGGASPWRAETASGPERRVAAPAAGRRTRPPRRNPERAFWTLARLKTGITASSPFSVANLNPRRSGEHDGATASCHLRAKALRCTFLIAPPAGEYARTSRE